MEKGPGRRKEGGSRDLRKKTVQRGDPKEDLRRRGDPGGVDIPSAETRSCFAKGEGTRPTERGGKAHLPKGLSSEACYNPQKGRSVTVPSVGENLCQPERVVSREKGTQRVPPCRQGRERGVRPVGGVVDFSVAGSDIHQGEKRMSVHGKKGDCPP